jgi:hypothetical protein
MRIRSVVTAVVIVVFASAIVSPAARAADNPAATAASRHVDFQQAIAHAAHDAASTPEVAVARSNSVNAAAMQGGYPGGGGGGHMMMIMSVVGTLAGIGMTYFMIKQVQKATRDSAQAQ